MVSRNHKVYDTAWSKVHLAWHILQNIRRLPYDVFTDTLEAPLASWHRKNR